MQNFLVLEKSAKDINRRKGNAKMRFKSIRCFCPICMRNIISSFEGVVRKNSINQLIQKCTFCFLFLNKKNKVIFHTFKSRKCFLNLKTWLLFGTWKGRKKSQDALSNNL